MDVQVMWAAQPDDLRGLGVVRVVHFSRVATLDAGLYFYLSSTQVDTRIRSGGVL